MASRQERKIRPGSERGAKEREISKGREQFVYGWYIAEGYQPQAWEDEVTRKRFGIREGEGAADLVMSKGPEWLVVEVKAKEVSKAIKQLNDTISRIPRRENRTVRGVIVRSVNTPPDAIGEGYSTTLRDHRHWLVLGRQDESGGTVVREIRAVNGTPIEARFLGPGD